MKKTLTLALLTAAPFITAEEAPVVNQETELTSSALNEGINTQLCTVDGADLDNLVINTDTLEINNANIASVTAAHVVLKNTKKIKRIDADGVEVWVEEPALSDEQKEASAQAQLEQDVQVIAEGELPAQDQAQEIAA